MKAVLEYYKARTQEVFYHKNFQSLPDAPSEALESMRTKGYYVWENYYSEEECAGLRSEIDALIEKYSDTIWKDDEDADNRVYFAERLSENIKGFNTDARFHNLSNRYLKTKTSVLSTLAGRIKSKGNNKGSGGGWHRDTNMIHQFKSIVYLTDVTEETGPFEYLEGTQSKSTLFELGMYGLKLDQNRMTDEEIDTIVAAGKYPKIQFTAKAGTCLLVDTSGIHRGRPLVAGERYALTNYFYQDYFINDKLTKKFTDVSPFRKIK